jgi:hypothetical protein
VLKVKEYFLFDPFGDCLNPQLQGYRLRGGKYHPVRAVGGRLPSRVLGLHLEADGEDLRLYDPQAQRWLPTEQEHAAQVQVRLHQQEDRAEQERVRAEQERVRAEQERVRAEQEHMRAEQEHMRAEQERLRAEQEQLRADRLAARLRELGVDPDA